jgi:sulfatase modifying factor 1
MRMVVCVIFGFLLGNYSNAQDLLSYLKSDMVLVEGGTFMMGEVRDRDSICSAVERPSHTVTLSSFYINKYDVTVKEFEVFVKETGYKTDAEKIGSSNILRSGTWSKADGVNWTCNGDGLKWPESEKNNPVLHISWNDANKYCHWLSKKTGEHYRLPTEAEWEFGSRGGNKSKGYKYAGSNTLDSVAWYIKNSNLSSRPVGQKQPNELGLYDMCGNAWQWCADIFDYSYYVLSPAKNPKGPIIGTLYAVRGGSYLHDAVDCRIAVREGRESAHQSSRHGFRVAKDL